MLCKPISTNKGLFVEGFDTETKKSLKTAKHKYFNQNYKTIKIVKRITGETV